MEVNGLDVDVGVEGVLVEEDCTTCVMRRVEAIREKLVVNVVRRFLQFDDVPHACNLFFEGIFFPTVGGLGSSCRYSAASAQVNDWKSVC